MIPSWYDVLGVEQSATDDEIQAAWRDAVAGLVPTDRRFKQRNRAAEVLLDPERRAAHDAELAAQEPEEDVADTESGQADATDATAATDGADGARPEDAEPVAASTVTLDKHRPETPAATPVGGAPAQVRGVGPVRIGLAVLLGLVALALVVATVLAVVLGGAEEESDESGLPDQREVAAAQAAAEAAVVPVLSFDYRDLDKSRAAAVSFMTDDYAEEYERNFAGYVEDNAPRRRTIVTTQVVASAIVRTGVDRVDVLLFVNRPTRNAERDDVSRDQVTLRMLDVDDTWLVDCLITDPGGSCGD